MDKTIPEKPQQDFNPNRLNIYICDNCGGHIVSRDVDQGTTPFMIRCEATTGCQGRMQSSMYRVFDPEGKMHHSHEWYRPTKGMLVAKHLVDHIDKGGLLLRTRLDSKANLNAGFKPTHTHIRTEGKYQVIGAVGLQVRHDLHYPVGDEDGSVGPHKCLEDVEFVLYLSSTGSYWARPKHEFEERFVAIS